MDAAPEIPASYRSEPSVTRRAVLLTSAAALVTGAAAGVSYEVLRGLVVSGTGSKSAPADLVAALDAESALIAQVGAALAAGTAADVSARALGAIRADHVAHEAALRAAVESFSATARPNSPVASSTPAVPAVTQTQLRAAELAASTAAARRASRLAGREAALLASIAACEATHAQVLA
jgi:hypothetical protein